MNTLLVEIAVANLIGYRENVIVPNVSWGMGFRHECDLIVMDKKKRLTEVEIKVSKSDLMADFKKPHGHKSDIIGRLIYAVPSALIDVALDVVPKECGVIEAFIDIRGNPKARWHRLAKHKECRALSDKEVNTLYRLAAMRTWPLKWALARKMWDGLRRAGRGVDGMQKNYPSQR